MSLAESIASVNRRIADAARDAGRSPAEITLVAATKTQTSQTIREAIASGITVCGENRVQEMAAHLDDNAYEGAGLHFIGHLQSNKVRQVVGRVDLIESVSSQKLVELIDKEAARLGLVQDILLEVNIAHEDTKDGMPPEMVPDIARLASSLPHVRLRGLMAIPPISAAPGANRKYFAQMRQLFVDIRTLLADNVSDITCLSMGMSGDFEDAVREGATQVRVGTALFGSRPPVSSGGQH